MTGFGLGHYEDKSISIDVEIRSFNSRYFELQTRYFDLSSETEYKIRKFLKDHLKRLEEMDEEQAGRNYK